MPIAAPRGSIDALIVTSRPDVVEIELSDGSGRLRPLKPSEAEFAPGRVEGGGSTDWVVSHGRA